MTLYLDSGIEPCPCFGTGFHGWHISVTYRPNTIIKGSPTHEMLSAIIDFSEIFVRRFGGMYLAYCSPVNPVRNDIERSNLGTVRSMVSGII
jgi:hypothetical protein